MGYQDLYSWQMSDWDLLTDNLEHKIIFIHGKEFESSQNVAVTFFNEIDSTKDYKIFYFQPKYIKRSIPFFSLYDCFLQYDIEQKIEIKDLGKNIIKDVFHSDTISYVMDVNNALTKTALSDQYREILIFIGKITEEIPPVFIFYNYSSYDIESKTLIQWMAEGKLDIFYPFLKHAKYIFLCDEQEDFALYSELNILKHIDIELREPSEKDVYEIWNRHTTHYKLTRTDINKIYLLSGGKLSNLELIANYLSMQNKIEWGGNDVFEFMTEIFDKRLSELKHWKVGVKEMMEVASEIGEHFDLRWLNHSLSNSTQDQYNVLLDKCCKEYFITCKEKYGKFVNKFVWEYFYNCSVDRKKELSLMLAQTVKYFTPYDYYSRAFYTEQSGNEQTALELYIYEYWKRLKESIPIPKELNEKIITMCKKYDLIKFINTIRQYYVKQSKGHYYETLCMLEEIECVKNLSIRLILLKDYLLSCIYQKVAYDKEMTERAIIIMEQVADNSKEIGEMAFWCDCSSTLISFYANTGAVNNALSISKALMYYYSQRKDFDNKAMIGIQVLNRKSSAFLSVEIAVKKTEESKDFFKNSILYTQYLMALNNHGANLFVLGKFNEAYNCFIEAATFLFKNPTLKINPVYILNNYCLAAFYSEKIDRTIILVNMKNMVNKMEDNELKIIPLINLSIFYMIHEKKDGVDIALNYLRDALHLNSELEDDYYTYYININRAAIYYLKQDYEYAITLLKKCSDPPMLMKSSEKIYLKKRIKEWLSIMSTKKTIAFDEFDTYLLNDSSDNTAWQFIGRGFLPSDLQFWSES